MEKKHTTTSVILNIIASACAIAIGAVNIREKDWFMVSLAFISALCSVLLIREIRKNTKKD